MHVVSYGRCKPCKVFCSQLLTFWSQYSMCLPLWSPDSLAFCYAASHTGEASKHTFARPIPSSSPCMPFGSRVGSSN